MEEQNEEYMPQEYAENPQDPNSLYADIIREERVKNVISQINPDLLLEDIEHRIRGEVKDRYTSEWRPISKVHKQVSELLISNYVSYLGSILNQNTALSNFASSEINNLMQIVVEHLRDDLSDNDEAYGFATVKSILLKRIAKELYPVVNNEGLITYQTKDIQIETEIELNKIVDYNEMDRIGNIILMSTFAVLKRAQNGTEARRIFSALKVTESLQPQNQKKGIMDLFKFSG